MQRKTNTFLASIGLIVACILVSGFIGAESAFAHTASIVTNDSISLDVSPSGDGVSIDEELIGITSTCNKGYDLTIATSTSANLYLNGDSAKTAAYTAVDGTSALNSSNNTNKWGYTTTSNPTSSTVFSPLSTTASSIRTISQTNNITNETIPIYYGIKTDNTIDPGSYSMGNNGTITYYLTMNPLCNIVDIAYDGNNADAGTMGAAGTGIIHTGVKDGDTVDLIASNFSRNGYGFAGWSTDPDAGTKLLDNDNTNNPVVYGPQESVTLPESFADNDTDNDGIVKLYAVWLQSQGNLQGWMGCTNLDTTTYDSTTGALDLTKNSVTALTDQRDGDTYAVARLADGKCWMIENLRLDADATRGNNQTDPTVTNEWLSQGYGESDAYGSFSGLADAESTKFSNSTAANSLYYSGTQSGDATINIGTSSYSGYRMPRYNNLNTQSRASNPTSNTFTDDNTTGGIYSYGNYYTWHAAIANLAFSQGDNSSVTSTSLCPAGWHLPTGGSRTSIVNVTSNQSTWREFYNIGYRVMGFLVENSQYPSYNNQTNTHGDIAAEAFRRFPNNFLYSGYFNSSSAFSRGSDGSYWSPTSHSNTSSYNFNIGNASVSPGADYKYKFAGYSIRCVASESENYSLIYDANGGSGTPGSQTTTANGIATFAVPSTIPTRSGYTFSGWIDENGNEVQSGGTFRTKDTNAVLYAIWTNNSCNPTATTIGTGNTTTDAVCLQDVTPSMKSSLPTADSTTGTYSLIDARDGQSYTVAKLADGELWLTNNLNYGSGSDVVLTPYDTDLTSGTIFVLPAADTTSYTATTNLAKVRLTNNSGTSDNGVYYSWAAAVANTNSISTNPTTSVCPKNWDLPTSTQYTNLKNSASYSSSNLTTAAPSTFLATGGFTNGATFYGTTNYGHYWTSTSSSSTAAYYAYLSTSALTVGSSTGTSTTAGGNKYYRKNIRCIASNGTATINYNGNNNDGGSMVSQTNVEINSTNLTSNAFTRTHYTFKNWNTSADGTGTTVANSAALSSLNLGPGDTLTLYAQWTPQRQIIYNDNCSYDNAGCATNTDTTNTSNWTKAGSNITLGSNTYFATRTGYAITSWNTERDGSGTSYNVSSSYTVPSNLASPDQVTLYAQWSPALTINFNSNGGSGTMTAQLIPENTSKALKSNIFTAPSDNYFIGWMTEESRATNTVVYANGATYTAPTTVTPGDSITLYAKWGPRYTIVYNGNNATGGSMISSGTELKHTNINEGSTVDLYAPNYWKTNYGFVGWSPSATVTIGGTDPIYGPNESISAPSYDTYGEEISGTKTITLYAVWLQADTTKTMQTFTTSDCQNLSQTTFSSTTNKITTPAGSVIALKDQRDNNVYTVARLADGNCWMTENLRLEAANTVGNNQTDSSVTNQSLSQGYGGIFTGLDSTENANFTNTTTATPNNLYNSTNITGSNPDYRFPRYNNNNTNTSLTASYNGTGSSTYYSWYSYGNYYTWAAAMANTTYYSDYSGTSGSDAAGTSLCPTNWHLPSSGTATQEFGTLSTSYGGTGSTQSGTANAGDVMSKRFRAFPNNFLYSGYFSGSSASNRGTNGHYWSRSASNSNNSNNLRLAPTHLYPSLSSYSKNNGFSVRCLIGS